MHPLHFPRVRVIIPPLKAYFPWLHGFLNPSKKMGMKWDWSDRVLSKYPELKRRLENVSSETKRRKIEYDFFTSLVKKDTKRFISKRKKFQKEWNKVNNRVMRALSDVVECEWPATDKVFTARLTPNPICPRFIKERRFDLFYQKTIHQMKFTAMHEIHHFIYFEKWKKVFPNAKPREFETPHLVWFLSEMVPGIILNDKRIQKIMKYPYRSYSEFEKKTINGKSLLSHLQKYFDERKSFADFLKKSWKFVQKHEKTIKAIP